MMRRLFSVVSALGLGLLLVAGAHELLGGVGTVASAHVASVTVTARADVLIPGTSEMVTFRVTNEGVGPVTLYSLSVHRSLAGRRGGRVLGGCGAGMSGVSVATHGEMLVQGRHVPYVDLGARKSVVVRYAHALHMSATSPVACEGATYSLGSVLVNAVSN